MTASHDKQTLAVACHDLGQFIGAHPSGRNIAPDVRAKEKVLPLMEDADAEVRKQSIALHPKILWREVCQLISKCEPCTAKDSASNIII